MPVKWQFHRNPRAAANKQLEAASTGNPSMKTAILATTKIILSRYGKSKSSVMNRHN
jgi:hypothetical protein